MSNEEKGDVVRVGSRKSEVSVHELFSLYRETCEPGIVDDMSEKFLSFYTDIQM